MKCPICKLEHESAYAIETVCVTTLRDHLNAALELLAIREEQIREFLEEKAVDTHVHDWVASTNKGVLAVCSVCGCKMAKAQE